MPVSSAILSRVRIISRCPLLAAEIRNTLVDDRYSYLAGYVVADLYKIAGFGHYLVVNLIAGALFAVGDTVEQRYSQRDSAYVEVLLGYHIYSFYDFVAGIHITTPFGKCRVGAYCRICFGAEYVSPVPFVRQAS